MKKIVIAKNVKAASAVYTITYYDPRTLQMESREFENSADRDNFIRDNREISRIELNTVGKGV